MSQRKGVSKRAGASKGRNPRKSGDDAFTQLTFNNVKQTAYLIKIGAKAGSVVQPVSGYISIPAATVKRGITYPSQTPWPPSGSSTGWSDSITEVYVTVYPSTPNPPTATGTEVTAWTEGNVAPRQIVNTAECDLNATASNNLKLFLFQAGTDVTAPGSGRTTLS